MADLGRSGRDFAALARVTDTKLSIVTIGPRGVFAGSLRRAVGVGCDLNFGSD
jgi:hypothetical protein